MTNPIQCTVDAGRLHISHYGHSLGSIDSYNNPVSQFFAYMYNWSMPVDINGKTRYIDKEDFAKWVATHTDKKDVTEQNVEKFTKFSLLTVKAPKPDAPAAHTVLSPYKTEKLARKLIESMYKGDFKKAINCVLQGAKLDKTFWTRGELGLCLDDPTKGFENKRYDIEIKTYTPLLFAGTQREQREQYELCVYMKELGANPKKTGLVQRFKREMVDHREEANLEFNPILRVDKKGKLKNDLHMGTRYINTLYFEDRVTTKADIVFNPIDNFSSEIKRTETVTEILPFKIETSNALQDHGRLFTV